MTTLTATYCTFCEALRKFGRKIATGLEIAGHARAADELARMGYHEEAKNCILRIKELKAE